jgi:hypothetical protein
LEIIKQLLAWFVAGSSIDELGVLMMARRFGYLMRVFNAAVFIADPSIN